MKLSGQIKPISYLKANAADIIRDLGEDGGHLVISQNGEAKAVLMSLESYERTQETLALLKIMALGKKQVADGNYTTADKVIKRNRNKNEL